MTLDPQAIADGGPVVIVIVGIIAIVMGAVRGDWVPGWIYRQAIARAEKAEQLAASAWESVDDVTETVQKALDRDRLGPSGG